MKEMPGKGITKLTSLISAIFRFDYVEVEWKSD